MMRYKDYLGHVELDDEAGLFHGEVVNTRDVITFQGRSVGELRQAFQDSVDDYLEWCAKRGKQPEKPYSGRFVVRIDPEVHRSAAEAARVAGKSLNAWVAELLSRVANQARWHPRCAKCATRPHAVAGRVEYRVAATC